MRSSSPPSAKQHSRRKGDTAYTVEELIERAVNEARKLPDYNDADAEEKTERHIQPQDIHFTVHMPQPSPSQHDAEESASIEVGPMKLRGVPKWVIIATGAVVAAVTALAARLLHK